MAFRVYIAGPHGFDEAGKRYHNGVVIPLLQQHGFEVIDPWCVTTPMSPRRMQKSAARLPKDVSVPISRTNFEHIKNSDAVLAHLDGAQVDDGTAAEIGYAAALSELGLSSDEMERLGKDRRYIDSFGWPVVGLRQDARRTGENKREVINFQVAGAVKGSGRDVFRKPDGTYPGSIHFNLKHALAALLALRDLKEGRSTDYHASLAKHKRSIKI